MLYPLKFHSIFKEKIWGGQKIHTILKKDFQPLRNCGESWEISGVKENISVVREGSLKGRDLKSLISEHKGDLVGERIYRKYGDQFPLLVKFIDANDDLSIQVHPDDELAAARHGSFGKTEMWYILQADKGASLISGFKKAVDKEVYMDYFRRGRLMDILNREQVNEKDMFFIPAGRVHTIGKGLLLAEIQQTSDVTYRIHDFDRIDVNGEKRELHLEESLDAIDYTYRREYKTKYKNDQNVPVVLAVCKYFTTHKINLDRPLYRSYADLDSFIILVCVSGEGFLRHGNGETSISLGDVVLIPAAVKEIQLESTGMELLETFITPEPA